jgi:hypothetical protein
MKMLEAETNAKPPTPQPIRRRTPERERLYKNIKARIQKEKQIYEKDLSGI